MVQFSVAVGVYFADIPVVQPAAGKGLRVGCGVAVAAGHEGAVEVGGAVAIGELADLQPTERAQTHLGAADRGECPYAAPPVATVDRRGPLGGRCRRRTGSAAPSRSRSCTSVGV